MPLYNHMTHVAMIERAVRGVFISTWVCVPAQKWQSLSIETEIEKFQKSYSYPQVQKCQVTVNKQTLNHSWSDSRRPLVRPSRNRSGLTRPVWSPRRAPESWVDFRFLFVLFVSFFPGGKVFFFFGYILCYLVTFLCFFFFWALSVSPCLQYIWYIYLQAYSWLK